MVSGITRHTAVFNDANVLDAMNFQILIYQAAFDVLLPTGMFHEGSTKESTEDAGPNVLLVKRDSQNFV